MEINGLLNVFGYKYTTLFGEIKIFLLFSIIILQRISKQTLL